MGMEAVPNLQDAFELIQTQAIDDLAQGRC